MSELYPSDNDLTELAGVADSETGVTLPTGNEDPWLLAICKFFFRLLNVTRRAGDLRVYKDGDLTYGVRPGTWMDGDTVVTKADDPGEALADDATNYIYYTPSGTLIDNTTGFPTTPHIPLATIDVGSASVAGVSSEYNHEDITDLRGRAIYSPAGGPTVTFGGETADEITVTVQGAAHEQLARVWIAATEFGAPVATGTWSVDTGTIYETETANKSYKIISDSAGTIDIGITIAGADTNYVMAEIDGRTYSSGLITWAA